MIRKPANHKKKNPGKKRKPAGREGRVQASHFPDVDSILQAIPDIFFIIDLNGKVVQWNRAGELLTGFSRPEIVGQSALKFFPEREHPLITSEIQKSLAGGAHRVLTWMCRRDGSEFPCQIRGTVLREKNGVPTGIAGIIRDMTEQREQLRQSEEQFRFLAEQTNALIFSTDTHGRFTYFNEAAVAFMGLEPRELRNRFYLDFVHPDDRKAVHERLRNQMLRHAKAASEEIRFRLPNGKTGWLNIAINPTLEKGELRGMNGLAIDITHRKQWELDLKESEERFKNIFDFAPVGIYQSTPEGKFVAANHHMVRMLGYDTLQQVLELDMARDVYADSADRSMLIKRFFGIAEVRDVEVRWRKRNGEQFWAAISTHSVVDDQGNVKYFEGFVRNIDKRKKFQEELLRNEKHFRSMIENSSDVIALINKEGKITYVSPSNEAILGYDAKENIGKSFLDNVVAEDRQRVGDAFARITKKANEIVQLDVRVRHKNGSQRTLEVIGHNLIHDPAVEGIVVNFRDVTERKEAEDRLKESESKYRELIEQASDGIFIANEDGKLLFVNERGRRMIGYSEKEIIGMPIAKTYADDQQDMANAAIDALRADKSVQFERMMRRKDGTLFPVEVSVKPLTDGTFQGIVRDITERKGIDEAIRESEEKFRSLAEESPNMIFINNHGKIAYVNRRCTEIMGYTKEEFYAEDFDFFTVVAPESRDIVARNYRAHLAGKEIQPYEYGLVSKAGKMIYGLHATRLIQFEGQRAILGIITDVTEQRKAEETQRKLMKALEQSNDVVFMTDIDGCITYVNPSFKRVYGYSEKEVIGQTPRLLKSDLYPRTYYEQFWKRLLGAESLRGEMVNKTKDGRMIHIEASVSPVQDANGKLIGFMAVQSDISERKETEEKIREQAALLDNATDGIMVIDSEGVIRYWNKGAERMFGWKADEVRDRTFQSVLRRDTKEISKALSEIEARKRWEGEFTGMTKEEKEITIQSRWTLLSGENGTSRSILVVNTDISEKKTLQRQFFRSQRLDSLGTLAGGIAHDLNNVLSPILLSFEVLGKRLEDEQAKKLLKTARDSALRGKHIVSQVLTFARGIEGERGTIQLRHLLDEIVNIAKETFPKSIDLETVFPKDLWTVSADATQMHQVFMNLVVNARDAMAHGGQLTLSAKNVKLDEYFCRTQIKAHPGLYVVISITDTGTGIPSTIMERIFDPFFTTKEVGKGTGLGLSTVHAIVNSHDGFVDVTSTVGKGTTFNVYLQANGENAEHVKDENPPWAFAAKGESVLVVDDERSIREISEQVLSEHGFKVESATDGIEAVALFAERNGKFDLVITDLMMPMMDGVATIRALRRIKPEVRIVAMSGLVADQKVMQTMDLAPDAFLTKPFTSTTLLQTIAGVLRKK